MGEKKGGGGTLGNVHQWGPAIGVRNNQVAYGRGTNTQNMSQKLYLGLPAGSIKTAGPPENAKTAQLIKNQKGYNSIKDQPHGHFKDLKIILTEIEGTLKEKCRKKWNQTYLNIKGTGLFLPQR